MSTNPYTRLLSLLPQQPLQVATIVAINQQKGYSIVQWPSGGQSNARGTSVSVGARAFIRSGQIEGPAPDLTVETVEV